MEAKDAGGRLAADAEEGGRPLCVCVSMRAHALTDLPALHLLSRRAVLL